MNVQIPKGRGKFSVFHEYDETFSLMDMMVVFSHQAHGRQCAEDLTTFQFTCFRAMQREAVLQSVTLYVHGLKLPLAHSMHMKKKQFDISLTISPYSSDPYGIRAFSERQGIREKETHSENTKSTILKAHILCHCSKMYLS